MGWFDGLKKKLYLKLLSKALNFLIDHLAGQQLAQRLPNKLVHHCFIRVWRHYHWHHNKPLSPLLLDDVKCNQASAFWLEEKCK